MRNRGYIFETNGVWGRATVYPDFIRIVPNNPWLKPKLEVIKRLVRRKKLKDHHIIAHSPYVARSILNQAMKGVGWYIVPYLASKGHIEALTDNDVEQILLFDASETWMINKEPLWLERTHDGVERHFSLNDVFSAQDLYDSGDRLAIKLWIVDALALGNYKFASALARCVSEKVPSGKVIQPMDLFAFWAEGGNIFAHTAFGEKVRLFKPEEINVATSTGYMYWKDFKTHSRRAAISALKTYF